MLTADWPVSHQCCNCSGATGSLHLKTKFGLKPILYNCKTAMHMQSVMLHPLSAICYMTAFLNAQPARCGCQHPDWTDTHMAPYTVPLAGDIKFPPKATCTSEIERQTSDLPADSFGAVTTSNDRKMRVEKLAPT